MPQTIPPPPKPRTDLPPPSGLSDEDYQEYLQILADDPVDAWRDQDGMVYLWRMPSTMAPASAGLVDTRVALAPDDPQYGRWVGEVEREFDFMEPTKVTPEPQPRPDQQQTKEVPDAQGAGNDTGGG